MLYASEPNCCTHFINGCIHTKRLNVLGTRNLYDIRKHTQYTAVQPRRVVHWLMYTEPDVFARGFTFENL